MRRCNVGSARESVEMYDWRGLADCPNLTAAVAGAVGMWEPASFAGRAVVAEVQLFRPRGAISTASPRFIGHSGENVLFGRPLGGNSRLSESRVECTILQILAQSRNVTQL